MKIIAVEKRPIARNARMRGGEVDGEKVARGESGGEVIELGWTLDDVCVDMSVVVDWSCGVCADEILPSFAVHDLSPRVLLSGVM
jgi:hypothetical protein